MAWTSAPSTIQVTRTEHKRQNESSVAIKVLRLRTATGARGPDTVSQSSVAFNFAVQLTHDGQRTGSCPLTQCNMLLGLRPRQLNHRKKGDELLLLICTPSNLARVHDGAFRHSNGELLPNVFRREAHGERDQHLCKYESYVFAEIRTAEVTICMILERTARSSRQLPN